MLNGFGKSYHKHKIESYISSTNELICFFTLSVMDECQPSGHVTLLYVKTDQRYGAHTLQYRDSHPQSQQCKDSQAQSQ